MGIDQIDLKKLVACIADNDSVADEIGRKIAEMLKLQRVDGKLGRIKGKRAEYVTSWGKKTNAGLARSVLTLILTETDTFMPNKPEGS